jgi:hypothetical protein
MVRIYRLVMYLLFKVAKIVINSNIAETKTCIEYLVCKLRLIFTENSPKLLDRRAYYNTRVMPKLAHVFRVCDSL